MLLLVGVHSGDVGLGVGGVFALGEYLIIFCIMAFHFVDTSERALDILFSLFCLLLYDLPVDNYLSAEDDSLERGKARCCSRCAEGAVLR